jgi:16S rRNA (uracil1498-N3)-methyltransferase
VPGPVAPGVVSLGDAATRHAQVLRLQPGQSLILFDGRGGEWNAQLQTMGRREASASVTEHHAVERELPVAVALALVMPAADRMDFVVEKATELGAASIQPLMSERSVLRLAGERAEKRHAHWQAIATAACEQCGRNRVPTIGAPRTLDDWLASLPTAPMGTRRLLAWRNAQAWAHAAGSPLLVLSGPEGGFSNAEEDAARARGFAPTTLGERVLRADTAPLAALASIALG